MRRTDDPDIKILYLDDSVCIIDKPPDVFVHPNPLDRGAADCLAFLRRKLRRFVFNVHRLDRPTSGVMVFALHQRAAAELSRQIREGYFGKTYLALVRGHLTEKREIDVPIPRSKKGERVPALSSLNPVSRVVYDAPVGRYDEGWFSVVEVTLHTGRFHQARRHLRSAGHPVIGDTSHGDPAQNEFFRSVIGESRLFLRSWRLELLQPDTGKKLSATAGLPEWWTVSLEKLGVILPEEFLAPASIRWQE